VSIVGVILAVAGIGSGAAGAVLLLAAGAREASGDLVPARRWARRGGLLLASSAPFLSAAAFWLAFRFDGSGLVAVLGIGCVLGAGVAGLLAGLSQKPRPSGAFATGLFLLGLLAILAPLGNG
jgi:hypothetical protein